MIGVGFDYQRTAKTIGIEMPVGIFDYFGMTTVMMPQRTTSLVQLTSRHKIIVAEII